MKVLAGSFGVAHGAALRGLLGLFVLRVVGQLVVAVWPVSFLPPFEAWHSGTLPYPLLVGAQVAIVCALALVARDVSRGRVRARPRLGAWLHGVGVLYAALMLARLVLGATWLRGSSWWDAPIPSLFHLVLAAYLLVLGHYHRGGAVRTSAGAT